jgi:hypothetical protein
MKMKYAWKVTGIKKQIDDQAISEPELPWAPAEEPEAAAP